MAEKTIEQVYYETLQTMQDNVTALSVAYAAECVEPTKSKVLMFPKYFLGVNVESKRVLRMDLATINPRIAIWRNGVGEEAVRMDRKRALELALNHSREVKEQFASFNPSTWHKELVAK